MRLFAAFALFLPLAAGCKKKTEPTPPAPDVVVTDLDRLQGTWGIELFEDGKIENLPAAEKAEALAGMKSVRFHFEGSKMTIVEPRRDDPATFVLNETANPKVMTLTPVRPSGTKAAPETWPWIYKFEGDTLVLATSPGDKTKAPTEFKARADEFGPGANGAPGVAVITLKKNDTPPPTVERPSAATSRKTTGTVRGTKK